MEQTLAPVIVRIIMRYLSGALVILGIASPEAAAVISADPDIQQILLMLVGAAIGILTELAYSRARATGGAT